MGQQTVYSITTEGNIYQEYQITASSSASSPLKLAFQAIGYNGSADQKQHVTCTSRGDNIVFKFGGSGVTADKTVTSSALAAGNFSVEEGMAFATDINGNSQNYVSVIAEGSGGTAIIKLVNINL